MKHFNFIKGFLLALMFVCAAQVKADENILVNGGFEEWSAGALTAWGKDDSNATAHNATIAQSTDACSGSYAVVVAGASGNKRLASKAYTLAAGTYSYTVYVKANGDEAGHCRLGYVPITDGKAGTYVYEEPSASAVTADWTARTMEFTLAEETTIAFVVMNNKTGNGASFLVDDVAVIGGNGETPGQPEEPEEPETPVEPETPAGEYINEAFTNGFGSFTTQETVGSYPWVSDKTYGAKASGYADGANHDAESWLISSAMDFSKETAAYIVFDYVINFGDVSAAASNHQLLITSNYTGDVATTEWTEVDFGAVNNGNWTFQNTGEIALPESMMGKAAVVIAFKYLSTTANSSTWEVKNVVVTSGTGNTPEQPEEPETPGEPETLVCTVTEALAAFVAGEAKPAVVKGYIVGSIDGKSIDDANFSGTATANTNLLIADDADETDITKCLAVQLPSGAVRSALNLVDNPGNYKKLVSLTGSLEKYFGVAGLKSVKEYSFDGDAPVEPEQPEEPETPVEPETPEIVVGENILLNSGFEEWNDGVPTAWGNDGSNATAHSATIAQSTDADSDIYAVEVAGAKGGNNKCLASKAYTLPAGTYSLSASIKQCGDAVGAFRLGYAVIKDGAIAYHYLNEATYVTEEYEEYAVEFTLEEETTVSVLVMNNSKLGDGASILVDDVELVAQETTAIEVTVEDSNADSLYYDLSGRVVKNPANGIYISNGKKVLVK